MVFPYEAATHEFQAPGEIHLAIFAS
jgi:hypothetical protein